MKARKALLRMANRIRHDAAETRAEADTFDGHADAIEGACAKLEEADLAKLLAEILEKVPELAEN